MGESAAIAQLDCRLAFVVDDNEDISLALAVALSRRGFRVEAFETAKAALDSCDRQTPAFIFCDVALLHSDAIDVLKGLAARRYQGTVQLMSSGRAQLLEAVHRLGLRHGVSLPAPIAKPRDSAAARHADTWAEAACAAIKWCP